MKKLFPLFLLSLLISFEALAQNYSTIHFVVGRSSGKLNYNIYLNENLAGTIKKGENLSYKVYTQGRITIRSVVSPYIATATIDIKPNSNNYVEIGYKVAGGLYAKEVDEKQGKEIFAKNSTTVDGEEDLRRPIGKIPTTSENSGPKQGSCFVLNKQGYLLTNHHVIDGAKTVQIKGIGNDFTTLYAADVIAKDIDLDLAVLKLKNQNIVFENVPYHISDEISAQGTKSLALGYPMTTSMGEEIKITEGIINAKSGYKGTLTQYQFSAAVQPGNSGSPLFNENGEVIGVINAKLRDAEGVGYALKSSYLLTFLKNVENLQLDKGEVAPLSAMPLSEKVAKLKGFIFIVKAE